MYGILKPCTYVIIYPSFPCEAGRIETKEAIIYDVSITLFANTSQSQFSLDQRYMCSQIKQPKKNMYTP